MVGTGFAYGPGNAFPFPEGLGKMRFSTTWSHRKPPCGGFFRHHNKPDSTTLQVHRVSRTAFRLPDPKARIPWLSPEAEVPVPNDAPVFPLALFHPGYLPRRPRRTAFTLVSGVAGAPLRAPHRADTLGRVRAQLSPTPVLHAHRVIRCAPTGGQVPSSAELRRV